MGMFLPFRTKKQAKPIINEAVEERNKALDDIYNWQNNKPQEEELEYLKKKKKK